MRASTVLLLVAIAIVLTFRVTTYYLKSAQQASTKTVPFLVEMAEIKFINDQLDDRQGKHHALYIILRADPCMVCLDEIVVWQKIAATENVEVHYFVDSIEAYEEVLAPYDLACTVHDELILDWTVFPRFEKVQKYLVDLHNGRVLYTELSNKDLRAQDKFGAVIAAIVN